MRFRIYCSRSRWGRGCYSIAGLAEASYRKSESVFTRDEHGWTRMGRARIAGSHGGAEGMRKTRPK